MWQYHLPNALYGFSLENPQVQVTTQVANSDAIERLALDRAIDVGLIGRESTRPALVSRRLAEDEALPIFLPDHPLASATDPGPEALAGESFITRESGSALRQAMDRLLSSFGVAVSTAMELGSQEAVKQAVLSGQGIGVATKAGLEPELRAGMLAIPSGSRLSSTLELHVVYLAERKLSLTQKAFLDMLAMDGVFAKERAGVAAKERAGVAEES